MKFSQVGVEWVGEGAGGAAGDIQMLAVAFHYLKSLKVPFSLKINSLGKSKEREEYKKALRAYFESNDSELSEQSRERIKRGSVLRVLDSKDVGDRYGTQVNARKGVTDKANRFLSKSAPSILEFLQHDSLEHFNNLKNGLDELEIPYSVDTTLVRGLDYYNDVVFEFVYSPSHEKESSGQSRLGRSQDTILAGGRYDSLCSQLGGPDLYAVGYVLGSQYQHLLTILIGGQLA